MKQMRMVRELMKGADKRRKRARMVAHLMSEYNYLNTYILIKFVTQLIISPLATLILAVTFGTIKFSPK